MADLYHLLDELDEHHDDDDINKGRPSIETEATEPMMSEDWDSPRRVEVPAALQEAEQRAQSHNVDEEEGDDALFMEGLEDTQHLKNERYAKLHHNWQQERHCPELLKYDEAMVDDLKAQLEERQDAIDQLESSTESVENLMATLAQLDLDRVKFVLSDWLSCRLTKIEAHPLYMREKVDHMSDAEIAYLKQYGAMLENHLRSTVLRHIPEAWQSLDEPKMIDKPDHNAYHFWLVKQTIDSGDMDPESAKVGSCLVAKYAEMRKDMMNGKLELQL